jgi:hypothetical protein
MLRNLKALYCERAEWQLALGNTATAGDLAARRYRAERRDRGMAYANWNVRKPPCRIWKLTCSKARMPMDAAMRAPDCRQP